MNTNKLGNEKSPYLIQHKNNPIWWQPWGQEAFDQAKKENKIIFLSVGYSTCHWCHVMEKDSFEKQDVADVLNQSYVSIKVDREERPDVDSIFMNVVQSLTGRGGWPMTVLLTPDGKPFWGGTFIAHDSLIQILEQVQNVWEETPDEIKTSGSKIAEYIQDHVNPDPQKKSYPEFKSLTQFTEYYTELFDAVYGGLNRAPKFPQTMSLMVLMREYRRSNRPATAEMITQTLKQMRRGGMYDQIGGGFHRYAVDDQWLIPHFEKMLYDNALLTSTYLEAYQLLGIDEFAQTAQETLEYVMSEMTHPEGAFYSAEDADSEHIEGKYYVWDEAELKTLLSASEFSVISKFYHTSSKGNFHAHQTGDEVTEKRLGPPALSGNVFFLNTEQSIEELNQSSDFKNAVKKLLAVRSKRVHPHLDDKIIVAWNALMVSAFCKAHQVLTQSKYLLAAQRATQFILDKMFITKEGTPGARELFRIYRDGVSHRAQAEDYACLIQACLDLYESDFDSKWFENAVALQKIQDSLFWDHKNGSYFDNDGLDPLLITRTKTIEEGVTPSANSVSCLNLLRLSSFTGELMYRHKALKIMENASTLIEKYPQAANYLLVAIDFFTSDIREVVFSGDINQMEIQSFLKELRRKLIPNKVVAYAEADSKVPLTKGKAGKLNFHICHLGRCELPTKDFNLALKQILTT